MKGYWIDAGYINGRHFSRCTRCQTVVEDGEPCKCEGGEDDQ